MVNLLKKLPYSVAPNKKKVDEIFAYLEQRYEKKPDPWGLDLNTCRFYLEKLWPFYRYYFRTRVHGLEHVQDRPYMVASNHSGQIAFDGFLIIMAFALEIWPPRILRGMVERFLPTLPFVGEMVFQTGSVLGDRKNCLYLLEQGESILAFPEGVKGIAKSTHQFYKLRRFSHGFVRMALSAKVDILPIAVVGAEEAYPFVYQADKLAKFLKLPILPLTPTFPLFGPLGLIPLPVPVDIYIGEPYKLPQDLSPDAPEKDIREHVLAVEAKIKSMIEEGLKKRRSILSLKMIRKDDT